MESTRSSSQVRDSLLFGVIPSEIALSAVTLPVVVGLVSAQLIAATIAEVGAISEELFRGDRLPILEFSEAPTDYSPSDRT